MASPLAAGAQATNPEEALRAPTRAILSDVVIARACERMRGSFTPLYGPGGDEPPKQVAGRLWIEDCSARSRDGAVALQLRARAWRWVDREREKLGARFDVNQYVRFGAKLGLVMQPDLAYDRAAHEATLYLVPTRAVDVAVEPLTEVEAEPEGGWGALLGTAATLVGQGPDTQATGTVEKQAKRNFHDALDEGYSLVVDLCTGQTRSTLGHLSAGEKPWTPISAADAPPRWLANRRIRLHADGLDLEGPFDADGSRVEARIDLRQGGPVEAQLVCAADARSVADAFLAGRALPDVAAHAQARVAQGTGRLRASADCPLVLVTRVASSEAAPATFDVLVTGGGDATALAPCGGEEGGPASGGGSRTESSGT